MNVAIEIPDDIGELLASQIGGVARAVLEAVAVEALRRPSILESCCLTRELHAALRWSAVLRLRAHSVFSLMRPALA